MLRVKTLVTAAALALAAPAAIAAEHTIMLMGDAYFPEVTYVDQGDNIRFVNVTETPQSATATDGSWSSGVLSANESFVLQLDGDTVLTFASDNNASMAGAISYEPAPLVSSGD